ncbi:protein of unknown function [Xenorhabdus poinarii G6]|uniref:Uncharacterized protein n=2 Tax=Xenorhabdus poinarii TaxID=40577 RepID=A0A068QZW6_9GAMM|nr:protein of unknown function [Xenorhabdus poinarii G6]
MTTTNNNSLKSPSYPQAVDGKIDIQAQKDQEASYILMLIPNYIGEGGNIKIVGYLKDTSSGNIITSSPKVIIKNQDTYTSVLFSIENFSENTTYNGYYTVTNLLSGSENTSETAEMTTINSDKQSETHHETHHETVSVPQATGNKGTLLTKDDYYRLEQLEIIVPIYNNMRIGQTVQVLWQGPKDSYLPQYSTDPQQVNKISPLTFYIPRMNFLDGIGSTIQIWFKVTDQNNPVYFGESKTFFLEIEKQRLNLPAPKLFYRGDGTIHVMIKYDGMSPPDSVDIRAIGKSQTQSNYKPVDDPQQMGVKLPEDWVNENRGSTVLIDYAVGSMNPGVRYDFSRILKQTL